MNLPSSYSLEQTTSGIVLDEKFASTGSLYEKSAWTGGIADGHNLRSIRASVVSDSAVGSRVSYILKTGGGNKDIINMVNESSFTVGRTSGLTEMICQHFSRVTSTNDHFEFCDMGILAQAFPGTSGVCYVKFVYINQSGGPAEITLSIIKNGTATLLGSGNASDPVLPSLKNTGNIMKLHTRNSYQAAWFNGVLIADPDTDDRNDSDTTLMTAGLFAGNSGFFGTNWPQIDDFLILSGNAVVVTGVPEDHFIQVGSETSQADGSVVTLDLGGATFPVSSALTLSIFDSSKPSRLSPLAAFSTTVYGGDTYKLSSTTLGGWIKPVEAARPSGWAMLSTTTEQDDIDFLIKVKSQYAHQLDPNPPTAVKLHESVISI